MDAEEKELQRVLLTDATMILEDLRSKIEERGTARIAGALVLAAGALFSKMLDDGEMDEIIARVRAVAGTLRKQWAREAPNGLG